MSKSLVVINFLWAIVDTIICAMAIALFGWGAWHFEKWWILLFDIIPLMFFSRHSLIVDTDIHRASEDNEKS